jgi:hypothetical protein
VGVGVVFGLVCVWLLVVGFGVLVLGVVLLVLCVGVQEARNRVSANKTRIVVTPLEWNAIQAGAVSNHKLEQILDNMDDKDIKALATPREKPAMTPVNLTRAKSMLNADHTRAEVAEALGVSVTTLNSVLNEGE